MQYTQEQLDQFKSTFAARRRRQLIAVVPVLLAAVTIGAADEATGTTIGGLPLSYALPVAIVAILGLLLFSFTNWRCPACNAYLGKAISPAFCSHCGTPLR